MVAATDSLPTDLAAAHAMIIAQRDALMAAEARASAAESEAKFRAGGHAAATGRIIDEPGQAGAIAGRAAHDHWMNSPSSGRIQGTIRL
jgi:hypothetical protein